MSSDSKLAVAWPELPLQDFVYFQEGPGLRNWQYRDQGIPFVNIRCIKNGRLLRDEMTCLDPSEVAEKYEHFLLNAGDYVVSSSGTLGRLAEVVPSDLPCMLNTSVIRFRPRDLNLLDRRYLKYFLLSDPFNEQILAHANGSAQLNYGPSHLKQMSIAVPPMSDQIYIGKLLGCIDDRISILHETNATLEAIAQAMFKSWFVDFDPVHAKQQGRAPEGMSETTAALFPDSFEESELGLVPRGWKVGTLANLAKLNPESWTTKNHPDVLAYIDLANVKDNEVAEVAEYLFDEAPSRARRVLRDGDTIIGTVRPGNRSFAFIHEPSKNLTASTGFAVLRPTHVENTEFVYLAATQDASIEHLAHLADGAAYPAVRPDVVVGIQCVLPSAAIMQIFHDVTAPLLSKVSDNKLQAQTLATLRDTLLPRLISGQLRLPEAALEEA